MTDERYPIGVFKPQNTYSLAEVKERIKEIEQLPHAIEKAVHGLTAEQLDTPYRDGGWTIRQVVHHLPDSHLNAYVRMKWTLTEDTPRIKAYDEKAWAETPENTLTPDISIELLKALHRKWVTLMNTLGEADLKKEFTHPDTNKNQSLARVIATYAWHGAHHLAHITTLKNKKGW